MFCKAVRILKFLALACAVSTCVFGSERRLEVRYPDGKSAKEAAVKPLRLPGNAVSAFSSRWDDSTHAHLKTAKVFKKLSNIPLSTTALINAPKDIVPVLRKAPTAGINIPIPIDNRMIPTGETCLKLLSSFFVFFKKNKAKKIETAPVRSPIKK